LSYKFLNIKSILNAGGGKSGFVFKMRSGNLVFNDDCCYFSSFLLSNEDNLSLEHCYWW